MTTTSKTPRDLISALKSGKYLPAHGSMYGPVHARPHAETGQAGHCCLGVAAEEAGCVIEWNAAMPEDLQDGEKLKFDKMWPELLESSYGNLSVTLADINDGDESGKFSGVIEYLMTLDDNWKPILP